MESLYFFTGIAVLVIAGQFAVHQINKKSYLHTPVQLPGLKRVHVDNIGICREEQPLTRSQERVHNYVDWFTSRNSAIHKEENDKNTPADTTTDPQRDQEVFVGMAVVHDTTDAAEIKRPESNIDRWYRSAVNA